MTGAQLGPLHLPSVPNPDPDPVTLMTVAKCFDDFIDHE